MSGTIIFGYDVETASESTKGFLAGARQLHEKYSVPWTIYVTGRGVEARTDDILKAMECPILTVGQHTYSHVLLKSIYMQPGDGKPVHGRQPNFFNPGGSLEQIQDEILKTNHLIKMRLGFECRGLTGPWGYYRGLVDRPDVLRILQDAGIRWIRADARDFRDCQPTPFTEQPFFYKDQGFPDILELGVQGYQDDFYWDRFDDRRHGTTYEDYLSATVRDVAANNWVWNVCSHDHGTATAEMFAQTKGRWIEDLIRRAQSLGVRFLSPDQLYQEMREGEGKGSE